MIQGIHHISMKTRNDAEYERVRAFYAGLLGMAVLKECDTCTLFAAGSGIIEIFRNGTDAQEDGVLRHFALAVDDVDRYAALVRQAGFEVFVGPKDVLVGGDAAFPARIAFCRGALGEQIEFFCQKWETTPPETGGTR